MPLIRAIRRRQEAQAGVKKGSQGEVSSQGSEPRSGRPTFLRKSVLRLARRKQRKPDPVPESDPVEAPPEPPPDPEVGAGSEAQPLDAPPRPSKRGDRKRGRQASTQLENPQEPADPPRGPHPPGYLPRCFACSAGEAEPRHLKTPWQRGEGDRELRAQCAQAQLDPAKVPRGAGELCDLCGHFFHQECYVAHLLRRNRRAPWFCSVVGPGPPWPSSVSENPPPLLPQCFVCRHGTEEWATESGWESLAKAAEVAEEEGRECEWCGEYFHWECYVAHLSWSYHDKPWICRSGRILRREPPDSATGAIA